MHPTARLRFSTEDPAAWQIVDRQRHVGVIEELESSEHRVRGECEQVSAGRSADHLSGSRVGEDNAAGGILHNDTIGDAVQDCLKLFA
jgi:hypothetical protein